ncbi:MAG TPA: ATP-binding cassette domain-containing protein, partial [Chloroflexota bacterium]|nr:ATP-binding cassette domain-containing protein [Chloroflexota bacterium]
MSTLLRENGTSRIPPQSSAGRHAPVLRLQGVTVRYGVTLALNEVSLEVGAGERIALVGDSGCGKTTLLSVVSGLRRPTMGTVWR